MSRDDHYREMMVEAIQDRREYRQSDPLPENPPPGPKWQAKQGLARLPLNGAEYAVLACLIDRASNSKGACYPSQEFISGWTFRPKRTVERAIASLHGKGLIRVIDRGTASNAYFIYWDHLFAAYRQMKAFEQRNEQRHRDAAVTPQQKVAAQDAKSGGTDLQKVAAKPRKIEPRESNLVHISAPSSDGAYVVILPEDKKEKEEGIQRGEVESASTNPQRPEGPSYNEANERVVGYCEPFHWDHLTQEEFDAAIAAEVVEVGAGRAVIDAAANKTWLATRKGKRQ